MVDDSCYLTARHIILSLNEEEEEGGDHAFPMQSILPL